MVAEIGDEQAALTRAAQLIAAQRGRRTI